MSYKTNITPFEKLPLRHNFMFGQVMQDERISYWKDEDLIYDDGTHVIVLNSCYTRGNASPAILEFLDYVRTDDDTKKYTSELANEAKNKVDRVRRDKEVGERFMTLEMLLQDYKDDGIAIGRLENLIELVCKKLRKGKSVEVIADELEEELAVIENICEVARKYAPDYDADAVFAELEE